MNALRVRDETELRVADRGVDGLALLHRALTVDFPGRIAIVSSFGAESVILLDLVARIDRGVPVIFLDTLKHFPETLAYRDLVVERLGLTDVRNVSPSPLDTDFEDKDGALWRRDPDRCCYLRKVLPLETALRDFDAWVTGRKRFQGGVRSHLEAVEFVDGKVKFNPLAEWTEADIEAAFAERDLPRHPLLAAGYLSIGCAPCTEIARPGEGVRSGRWVGLDKTECGIHSAPRAANDTSSPGDTHSVDSGN